MAVPRKTKPSYYTEEDHKLLRSLFRQFGDPNKARRFKYWEDVCDEFNSKTESAKRNPIQIRGYFRTKKQKNPSYPLKSETGLNFSSFIDTTVPPPDILEPLSSPSKQQISSTTSSSSSSGYVGSSSDSHDEFRSMSDDISKPWEYSEISSNFLAPTNDQGSSIITSDDREEPHIFDDIDDFTSIGRTSAIQEKNGMSSDLVTILAEQARQHHKLKMKLLKEKFRKVDEVCKMKIRMLESELEMKRKEHEKKMDILAEKYRKAKRGVDE